MNSKKKNSDKEKIQVDVHTLSLILSFLYTSAYLDCFIATKIARIIKPAITTASRYSPRVIKKNDKNRHKKKIMIAAMTREVE